MAPLDVEMTSLPASDAIARDESVCASPHPPNGAPGNSEDNQRKCWRSGWARWSRTLPSLLVACIFLLSSSCYVIDPRCFFGGNRVQHHGSLHLQVRSEHRGTVREIFLGGDGILGYDDLVFMSCRRAESGRAREAVQLWSRVAREFAAPECGQGFAVVPVHNRFACARSEQEIVARGYYEGGLYLDLTYDAVDRSVRFVWDLRAELPGLLEEAVNGTWKVLCEESARFSRYVRRNLPELAAASSCDQEELQPEVVDPLK